MKWRDEASQMTLFVRKIGRGKRTRKIEKRREELFQIYKDKCVKLVEIEDFKTKKTKGKISRSTNARIDRRLSFYYHNDSSQQSIKDLLPSSPSRIIGFTTSSLC